MHESVSLLPMVRDVLLVVGSSMWQAAGWQVTAGT
jgi:hypothetical protein